MSAHSSKSPWLAHPPSDKQERWSKLQERADRASRREDSLQKQIQEQWERLIENVPNRNSATREGSNRERAKYLSTKMP